MRAGFVLLAGLAALVGLSLASLVLLAPGGDGGSGGNGGYLAAIAMFTVMQAALSSGLSLILGAMLALALTRRQFLGRRLLLEALGTATALPGIVTVFAVTAIYGRAGIVNSALGGLGLPQFSIYGLAGILVAHVFLNASMATRVFANALAQVPGERWRIAASLGMPPLAILRLIDAPVLRREAPGLALIMFIACAISFAVPLALGGGPGNATFEVAIYQAVRFDVDFARAAQLAIMQIAALAVLIALTAPMLGQTRETAVAGRVVGRPDRASRAVLVLDSVVIGAAIAFFLPLLVSVLLGLRALPSIFSAQVLHAALTSLVIAFAAAALAALAALVIGRARIALEAARRPGAARLMSLAPLVIMAVPPVAFAAGLFVLARRFGDTQPVAAPALILINAMMALPFVHRIIDEALVVADQRYGRLAQSLGMSGLARLRLVEAPILRAPASTAFALAMALSLGDLGVVSLFGSSSLTTLPALLYSRLGSYRMGEAEGVAALLALMVLALFVVSERLGRRLAAPG